MGKNLGRLVETFANDSSGALKDWARDEKTTIGQIAKDFGVHEGIINKWLRQASTEAVNKPGH